MFKLRKEHIAAFEAQAAALFTVRALAHVKAVWPAECGELGDAALNDWVKAAVQRAGALGLSIEHDVARFVDLTFILGRDFEHSPLAGWARMVLADKALSPEMKINRLYEQMEMQFTLIEKRNLGRP